jgi:cytochrome c oxidase accessory protein FixG
MAGTTTSRAEAKGSEEEGVIMSSLPVTSDCGPGTCNDCGGQCVPAPIQSPTEHQMGFMSPQTSREHEALLPAPEHVLSTLEKDGSRRWMRPKLAKGPWWHRRRVVAYILMAIFVAVPYVRIFGRPLIQLDIAAREFTILGHTFLPTDTLLLALAMLSAAITIVFVTTVVGRVWCGWACPQTVFIEFLFRPIDRIFDGTVGKGGPSPTGLSVPARIAKFVVYTLLIMFLAHTFLAYFIGTERLAQWMRSSPVQHPTAFIVMLTTTGLLMYDFMIFREQTCLIACPYGRFQSVMLDPQSMIVAYDYTRGEPRKKGKHHEGDGSGHCVDCKQCVVVCPTGIDIRNGLQMECINCTQCIDACDSVMEKVGSPKGLIRYSSQDGLAKKKIRLIRARTIIYPVLLVGVLTGLILAVSTKYGFDARMIRGKGAPFTLVEQGVISNSFNMRLVNRTDKPQRYNLKVIDPPEVQFEVVDDSALELPVGHTSMVPIRFRFPASLTLQGGNRVLKLEVTDGSEHRHELEFKLLGPRQ